MYLIGIVLITLKVYTLADRDMEDKLMSEFSARQKAGFALALAKSITQKDMKWLVPSQSGEETYVVFSDHVGALHCTCPDHRYRNTECKHIHAAAYAAHGVNKKRAVH